MQKEQEKPQQKKDGGKEKKVEKETTLANHIESIESHEKIDIK